MSESFNAIESFHPAGTPEVSLAIRWRRLRINSTLLTGISLLLLVILVAIIAPLLTPYNPIAQDLNSAFLPPGSPGHILGTDNFGRDELSRIIISERQASVALSRFLLGTRDRGRPKGGGP